MTVTRTLHMLLAAVILLVTGEGLALAASKGPTGPAQTLRFRAADGWGAPGVQVSDDRSELTLRFRKAPKKPEISLNAQLTEKARRVFTGVEIQEDGKRTIVHLQLARPIGKLKRKKYLGKNWLIRVQLKGATKIGVPSYSSVFPQGLERIVAEETERSLRENEPDCGGMNVLRKEASPWSLYATLLYAECLQERRKYKDARKMARRTISQATPESALGMLTALRVNQWKKQKSYPLQFQKITWNTLPSPLAQELGLRLAQRTYSRDLEQAAQYFLEATRAGPLDSALMNDAQTLRFDILQRSLVLENHPLSLALADSLQIPASEHPAYAGIVRATALVWSREGRSKEAIKLGSLLLPQAGKLVDKTLAKSLKKSMASAGLATLWTEKAANSFASDVSALETTPESPSTPIQEARASILEAMPPMKTIEIMQSDSLLTPGIKNLALNMAPEMNTICDSLKKRGVRGESINACNLMAKRAYNTANLAQVGKPETLLASALHKHSHVNAAFYADMNDVKPRHTKRGE